MSRPLVLVESPFAGRHGSKCSCPDCAADVARNLRYARAALRDSLNRGEAPFASAPLYAHPEVYDDTDPAQRKAGIEAGLAWGEKAELTAVYDDLGISSGMKLGIVAAARLGRPVEFRSLPGWSIHASPAGVPTSAAEPAPPTEAPPSSAVVAGAVSGSPTNAEPFAALAGKFYSAGALDETVIATTNDSLRGSSAAGDDSAGPGEGNAATSGAPLGLQSADHGNSLPESQQSGAAVDQGGALEPRSAPATSEQAGSTPAGSVGAPHTPLVAGQEGSLPSADTSPAEGERRARRPAEGPCMAPDCDEVGECPPDQKGARFGPLHFGLPLSIRREFARDWKRKQAEVAGG